MDLHPYRRAEIGSDVIDHPVEVIAGQHVVGGVWLSIQADRQVAPFVDDNLDQREWAVSSFVDSFCVDQAAVAV